MSQDYKGTLNLPQTDFPMKANLAAREPEILQYWDSIHLYEQLEATQNTRPSFVLADGPPYANGAIHIGHAVNKILKDFIIKSKQLSGFYVPYIPGWDCHGLPIELNVEKKIGKPNREVDPKTFRKKCREYAEKQIELQREAFIRLGVLGDWKNPYSTMHYEYEANTIRALAKIVAEGHLQKGHKPVHWCIDCGSALAEAEVEYQDKTSPSILVTFAIADLAILDQFTARSLKNCSVVIWTTTPWTLPANQAVAVHPDFTYLLIGPKDRSEGYWVAKERAVSFAEQIGLEHYEVMAEVKGAELEQIKLVHPFYSKEVPMVLSTHVTLDAGTGCVHIAPAHGQEDYLVGKAYGLPLESPVGSEGLYGANTPIFAGEHVFKANDRVLALLKEKGRLLSETQIQHSYPHCWRHKTPIIFRATQQWFISMQKNHLRANALSAIQNVQWIPGWGQARIEGMIADRPDWCLSRQRTWGVPLSLFVHRETGELHPKTDLIFEAVALKVEKEGVDAWHECDSEAILGTDGAHYEKVTDILDVWFDSGVFHYSVLEKRLSLKEPADLYLEGSDQHRGWFQSSLLTSVAMNNRAPYKAVLTHGFTVDALGRKMSKSLGNVVAPEKVISTLGADVLRLWVATTDYRAEMSVSDDILKQASDIYRRIRNTARFLLANLSGFVPEHDCVQAADLLALDRFIVERAMRLQADILKAYEEYQFHTVYQLIHNFCTNELGGFYLDVIKDRQYTGKKEGHPRLSAQTALYYIAEALVRWIAPILSFTSEEIWKHLPGTREASVFLSGWYTGFPLFEKETEMDAAYWEAILALRNETNKALEIARTSGRIGSGLEAEVKLYLSEPFYTQALRLKDELRFVLITSRADVISSDKKPSALAESALEGVWIEVSASSELKCDRCWHRRADVNHHPEYPNLCGRCVENVAGAGESRWYA